METKAENELSEEESGEPTIKLRRRRLSGRKKYCPKCFAPLVLASTLSGWLVPEFYACTKCGYSGHVALEDAPKEK
ncbi:MAG: hypothetical protein JRN20_16285 [Nitrososphaerota archaeon]|nr:hypothetical protein [Nitrososphaerota archaeon]MDG6923537.1 hypothetical protein [Nitrososphaerota archaeon]